MVKVKWSILTGDARASLEGLESGSVRTCVTSPPYWGLRDYGIAGQMGLESSPNTYISALVNVFAEVKRVLTTDGTVWLNLGDSYASSGGDLNKRKPGFSITGHARVVAHMKAKPGNRVPPLGYKPKDLIGIPWLVAFALRADGWYLRSDIIWSKPNPMPESVTDRPTKAHEYIFLLSKSAKYFYDFEAAREPGVYPAGTKGAKGSDRRRSEPKVNARPADYKIYDGMRNRRSVWHVAPRPFKGAHFATYPEELITPCVIAGSAPGDWVLDPFTGSGTTGVVALKHGRNFIGCELNPEYSKMAKARLRGVRNAQ